MIEIIERETFPENPGNPARAWLDRGVIELNASRLRYMPEYAQEFVLEHEKGHLHLNTFDETKADGYALQQLALKKPNSLWHFIKSVKMVNRGDMQRERAAEMAALRVAALHGSKEAQELLGRYANATGTIKKDNKKAIAIVAILVVVTLIINLWIRAKK